MTSNRTKYDHIDRSAQSKFATFTDVELLLTGSFEFWTRFFFYSQVQDNFCWLSIYNPYVVLNAKNILSVMEFIVNIFFGYLRLAHCLDCVTCCNLLFMSEFAILQIFYLGILRCSLKSTH